LDSVARLYRVSRKFGDQVALDDVTLTVEEGEFVCLVGHSGAGKTTLLNVINRQLRPTSGEVWVAGLAAHALAGRDLSQLRRRVATVFQDHKLLPELTAQENVAFAVRVTDVSSTEAEANARAVEALDAVEMAARAHALPRQLSYGQCQRVALARAIVSKPVLLLADEPTGNLDDKTADTIVALLERIGERGTAIVLATHNLDVVRRLQKRVIRLAGGRVVEDRPALAGAPCTLRLAQP
jgi:cell division transport system ATP-binding protein